MYLASAFLSGMVVGLKLSEYNDHWIPFMGGKKKDD
jgi:hypothetical protein